MPVRRYASFIAADRRKTSRPVRRQDKYHAQPHEDDAAATHIALRTQDIQASYRALKKAELKTLNEPVTNADGTQWFYFLTPWGSQIELVAKGDKSA